MGMNPREWLAEEMREWRRIRGLSIMAAARKVGLGRRTWADLEGGRTRPHPRTVRLLREAGIYVPLAFRAYEYTRRQYATEKR